MQYPRAEYSASKNGLDSSRIKNDCVPCAGTSQDYRNSNVCQVDLQQPRVSEGFKRSEKWFFRVCRRAKNPRNHCNESRLIPTESKLVESSSTQTWEPWNRGTCVSKFLNRERLNQTTVITPRQGCLSSFENELNDNYDRPSELRDESNNQGKSSAAAKSSTNCNRDGCGVCEAMRDRVFAEMALQTDATSYKIIMCGSTKDQTQNFNLNEKSSKVSQKSRLHPGPSSNRTNKVSNKTNKKLVNKKTSVGLQTKKPRAAKKRSTLKAGKIITKKINSSSSGTRGDKFETGKKPRVTAGKKSAVSKACGKGATLNRVTATTSALPVKIGKRENAAKTLLVEENAIVDEAVAEVEINNNVNEPRDEEVTAIVDVEKVSREYSKQEISIQNETFELKRSSTDKVSSKKSEDDEADRKETSTCSSKCQGILTQRSDYVKVPISSSSSSQKQFENGSTAPGKMENVRRRSHRIKPKSTLKSAKAHSSTSSSTDNERDDLDPPRKKRPKRPLVTEANSAEKDLTARERIIQEISKDNSGTITNQVASTGESGEKSNTTMNENEDQSHSSDYEKLNYKKSSRQSSVMMIWHWLRERYHDTPTKAFSSFGSTDHEVKDPFLSLFLPVMQTKNYEIFQVNKT